MAPSNNSCVCTGPDHCYQPLDNTWFCNRLKTLDVGHRIINKSKFRTCERTMLNSSGNNGKIDAFRLTEAEVRHATYGTTLLGEIAKSHSRRPTMSKSTVRMNLAYIKSVSNCFVTTNDSRAFRKWIGAVL